MIDLLLDAFDANDTEDIMPTYLALLTIRLGRMSGDTDDLLQSKPEGKDRR